MIVNGEGVVLTIPTPNSDEYLNVSLVPHDTLIGRMSCSVCNSKFSFFLREVACPGCGFSCCSKCLKYKCDLAAKGKKKVCGRCYNKQNSRPKNNSANQANTTMQDNNDPEEPMAPVDITKKLDSLENPTKPPITMYTNLTHWDKFKKGMEPADQEIVERLRKLKEEDKNVPLPSDDEIRRRLAMLKDQDPDANGSNHRVNIHQIDTRTDQEKTDDLIKEYLEQLELSSGTDPTTDIEARLRVLQGRTAEHHGAHGRGSMDHEDDDEEHVNKRIIKKALAEAALESKYEEDVDEVEDMETGKDSDDEEKPSCVMCEQTKNLRRCIGCTGDLYCTECFEDNHDDFELHKHKTEPFSRHRYD